MIVFEHVSKTYRGGVDAVRDLSLEVMEGETLVLLGTSGSGKTTTMKMVNRLIEPTSGRILIEDTPVMEQDPIELRRRIGYAIQHIGLFLHMTVGHNIAVVPKLLKWPRERIERRVRDLLDMVGLPPDVFQDRYPAQLSGGQRQRVGVARALGADPPLVLMDEPFGALDPITREGLQDEFVDLQAQMQKTIIFVTHDVFEAVKMGDRIALLDEGRLQQLATPAELVERPANEFVDAFLGQHRFQLSLLTQTVKPIVAEQAEEPSLAKPPDYLSSRSTLIEALDMFKRTGAKTLPVFEEDTCVGRLNREDLIGVITSSLREIGQ